MILNNTYTGSCIYSILNKDRGLIYIGQTRNYQKRSKEHLAALKRGNHTNIKLQRAFNCTHTLLITPIEECLEELLNEREIHWIKLYKSTDRNCGYNFSQGGDFSLLTLTPEAQKRKADARRGNPGSLLGRSQTEAHKLARSIATKGIPRPMSIKTLQALKDYQKTRRGTRSKGKIVKVTLPDNKIITFNSKREVEDFLGLKRDTLIHKFYYGKPRQILKKITFKEFIIER
jgi:group I intron endonuclease